MVAVVAAAVAIADAGVAVDAIADCSFVAADEFVADGDHVGLENLNFDNFPYSAKKIKILSEDFISKK